MTWRVIETSEMDIFRNLAIEEALAKVNAESEEKECTLRFWQSNPAVVMGRFQCTHLELNIDYCRENGIPIARRFTGGGTVYHDKGNLNITLCMDQSRPYVSRTLTELYWNFFGAIANALRKIKVPAYYDSDRQCLRINGRKITGTAGWLKRGVSFIHGTLLIDSDLQLLNNCLHVPPNQKEYYRSQSRIRCKPSKRDVVTVITKEVGISPSLSEIKRAISEQLAKITEEKFEIGELTQEEIDVAEALYQTRYSQEEWNMGIPANSE